MKFLTIAKCGRIEIEEIRNKKMVETYEEHISNGKTIIKRLIYDNRIATTKCAICKHAIVADTIGEDIKYGNKIVSCQLLVMPNDGIIPPDWIESAS